MVCLATVGLAAAGADSTHDVTPPNIVVIYTDDLGYGDVGCYGATQVQTPHIDRLAREGRRFIDAHAVSAVCTPSRYALLTGEYPYRVKSYYPVFARTGLIIDPAKMTIARLLRQAGYATAIIGKWHLGMGTPGEVPDWNQPLVPGPRELGFDLFFGLPTVNSHSPFVLVQNDRVLGLDPADPLVHGGVPPTRPYPEKDISFQPVSGGATAHALYQDEQLGTQLTERAVRWIEGQRDGPFFLLFATPHIHHPFTPHPRFQGTSAAGRYGDFIHELDWMVGQLLDALEATGKAGNTLVIFTSDNGGMLNEGGRDAWRAGHHMNGELLGFKFGAWEGGHRIPFIARWPGRVPAATTSAALIANVDLLATVAAVIGTPVPPSAAVDSYNVLPALTGPVDTPARDHVLIAPLSPRHLSLRMGEWMYIPQQSDGGFSDDKGGPASIRFSGRSNSDITAIGEIAADAPPEQLYHLATDPAQSRNVVRDYPAVANRLRAQLERLRTADRTVPLE